MASHVSTAVLLTTAHVILQSLYGHRISVRALNDPAAVLSFRRLSFITQHVAQSLRLPGKTVHVSITGVGGSVAQDTTREVHCTLRSNRRRFYAGVVSDLSQALQRFWEVEKVPKSSVSSPGDTYCEEHLASTAHQQPNGRYLVRLPFCKQADFPKSRHIAKACLLHLERRFALQSQLANDYRDFIHT